MDYYYCRMFLWMKKILQIILLLNYDKFKRTLNTKQSSLVIIIEKHIVIEVLANIPFNLKLTTEKKVNFVNPPSETFFLKL